MSLQSELSRRRTFAIVSHPDAGKTTLTEKLLLYGGAVQLAGSVTARRQQRATVSDWLEIEKQRGISVSSTVLNFDYEGCRINLLDTPGHNDFSEDTYRVLMAVDSVIMVIDGGKGVESQTRKLFEVCRRRHIPVFTFVNKMDRPARETLEILDEIEQTLDIEVYPMNWPLGSGVDFKGVWDRQTRMAHMFERTARGAYRAPVTTVGLEDQLIRDALPERIYHAVIEESQIVETAGAELDLDEVAAGHLTPVFFGSAVNNFGIQLLLDSFVKLAPPPQPRHAASGQLVAPSDQFFSGFVFKIQANMDPRHRDRMLFIRIVSGRFEKDMSVIHIPTGATARLSNSSSLFGRDRVTVHEAYPGDVIGIVTTSSYAIGDTFSERPGVAYAELPRFAPECFTTIYNPLPSNYKRFQNGLTQLVHEGLVYMFELTDAAQKTLVMGAVGPLQFELVKYRLESEYNALCKTEPAPWKIVRWFAGSASSSDFKLTRGCAGARDQNGANALLFEGEWHMRYFIENNPKAELLETPVG